MHMGACIVPPESVRVLSNGIQMPARLGSISSKSKQSHNSTWLIDSDVATSCRHGKDDPLEGEDFFFNYRMRRLGCRSLLAMDQ
jgi:hypothetical protein